MAAVSILKLESIQVYKNLLSATSDRSQFYSQKLEKIFRKQFQYVKRFSATSFSKNFYLVDFCPVIFIRIRSSIMSYKNLIVIKQFFLLLEAHKRRDMNKNSIRVVCVAYTTA